MSYPVATGMPFRPVAEPEPEALRLTVRDGARLSVWRAGRAFRSERRVGSMTLGQGWSDLADLAAMLHCSRPAFIAEAERVFGVKVDPASGDDNMAWAYDSEQAVPKRIIEGGPAECRATRALHIVSWDAALDLNGAAGTLLCLHCGELLHVRAESPASRPDIRV